MRISQATPPSVAVTAPTSKLPRTSTRRPRPLRMINQRRRLPHGPRRPHPNRNRALNAHHHSIAMLSERQPGFLPFLKMLGGVDRAAYMPFGADRPVLGERGGADDGGRVDAPFAPDFVGAAVAFEGVVAGVVGVVGGVMLVGELGGL